MRDANPYVPSDVENPSMALTNQNHLKVDINLLKDLINSNISFCFLRNLTEVCFLVQVSYFHPFDLSPFKNIFGKSL